MHFFMYLLYKTIRFHFPVICSVIDAQRTSQGKNVSDPLDNNDDDDDNDHDNDDDNNDDNDDDENNDENS